jgi:hypothetical protein
MDRTYEDALYSRDWEEVLLLLWQGAPDSEQWLSGAPPNCLVAPLIRAPTVEPQRLGDMTGALDCPVRPSTAAFPNGHFGGWGYK